jgi:hypothetical protein
VSVYSDTTACKRGRRRGGGGCKPLSPPSNVEDLKLSLGSLLITKFSSKLFTFCSPSYNVICIMARSVFAELRGKATRLPSRAFRVVAITLATGESLPTLVRSSDWMPVRVPTRWAVRRRRFECMDSTLANDLRGIAYLYEWAATTLQVDLDEALERSEVPTGRQLDSLIAFLRQKPAPTVGDFNSLATVATKSLSIRSFLLWAADPANQGNSRRNPSSSLQKNARC